MHITIFLKDGKTLRFERITNLKKNFHLIILSRLIT